tara:strand:- start:293 stop:589 length:297 start_codon:yes stop_codon:yes gene_type:complete
MDYARNAQGLTCNQALLTSALVGGVVAYKPQLQALLPLPPIVHFVAAGALTQMVCRLTGTPTMRTPMNEIVYGGAAAVVGGMIVGKYSSKAVSPVFQM